MNAPWVILRHIEMEDIGTLAEAFRDSDIQYRYVDVFRGDPVPPNAGGIGGMVVMGGPMGVYEADRYPFLLDEMCLIRMAAQSGLPVLGICLGAQLIAGALGANVYPGPRKEIGWYAVESIAADPLLESLPPSFMAFHWHGDTFDLPEGAVRLFRSDAYANQAFRWGVNLVGLQFHLEVNAQMISAWLEDAGCRAELSRAGLDPEPIRQRIPQWAGELERIGSNLFHAFIQQAAVAHGAKSRVPESLRSA